MGLLKFLPLNSTYRGRGESERFSEHRAYMLSDKKPLRHSIIILSSVSDMTFIILVKIYKI